MGITVKTRKTLWGRSGNRCAICKKELVHEKDPHNRTLNLGEECHIISEKLSGPRNSFLKNFDYDSAENLILLCCNHHTQVDEQIEMYSTQKLKEIKSKHEKWVNSNLNKDLIETPTELSKEEKIISFVVGNHNEERNLKTSEKIIHSNKGIEVAQREIEKVKIQVNNFVEKLNKNAPEYNILVRENRQNIVDVIFNINTLLIQFYQTYGNAATGSYLLFGIVDGLFDKNGHAVPFYEPKNKEIIRLDFAYNDKGEFGWRNREGEKEFYTSSSITELWLEKFFKKVINNMKASK